MNLHTAPVSLLRSAWTVWELVCYVEVQAAQAADGGAMQLFGPILAVFEPFSLSAKAVLHRRASR